MKLIEQELVHINTTVNPLKDIEYASRNCYNSFDKMKPGSDKTMVKKLIDNGHEAMLEFGDVQMQWKTNRGVMAELTRHRHCNFAINSTRYIKYDEDVEFIKPVWFDNSTEESKSEFMESLIASEKSYHTLLKQGWSPQYAREVLPNALATNIIFKCNYREMRHILKLRCALGAHPQIRYLALQSLIFLHKHVPIIFDDIYDEYIEKYIFSKIV